MWMDIVDKDTTGTRILTATRNFIEAYVAQKRDYFEEELVNARSEGGSPIEQLMAMALIFSISMEGHFGSVLRRNYFNGNTPNRPIESHFEEPITWPGIEIDVEVPVGAYRADFLIKFAHQRGGIVFGVIECDGHDYHERTKQQASHDKARDRYFQSLGLLVLRYTGAEIWRDPLACASNALEILELRAAQESAPRWGRGSNR